MNITALKQLTLRPSGALLDMEPLSDTGNAIPVGVRLQAPAGLQIVSFEVFAPENPETTVLRVQFGAPVSSYRFDTRIRLAASQDVWLIAKLTDGSLMGHHAPTVLTSSACFDAS